MPRLFPIVIIILSTLYFLPALPAGRLYTHVSAQDITPSVTPAVLINPQGASAWDNFISNLIPRQFKQVPDTLEKENCSKLPFEACKSIKNPDSLVNPQSNDDSAKKESVSNAAGQYTIASGAHTPPEVSNASTNIISDFFAKLADILNIFNRGEKEAKNSVTNLPQEVKNQLFNPNTAASGNSNVLGAQAQGAAMDRALPMVQCGALPAGLCGNDNKPNVVQPNL